MPEKTKVLIVDDDIEMCKSLSDILSLRGYEVFFTHSGFAAIERVKKSPPDVVLMDIKMPVMDGVAAFKQIKAISVQTKVIMMTAYSVEDLIKEALREGAFGVIYKPLDIDKCIKLIEQAKKGALIMVVDDDPNICKSLQDVLGEKGYKITTCKSGEDALQKVREQPHNILFIDVKLPTLNGLETYLAIRDINPQAKAVMMTAFREETAALIEQAKKNDAYACLYKPFDIQEVLKIIEEITSK